MLGIVIAAIVCALVLYRIFGSGPRIGRMLARGDVAAVTALFQRGVDINSKCPMALMIASRNGRAALAGLLIERGALVNPQGERPLIAASIGGHGDVVRLLLEHGAEVNASRFGTALSYAVTHGHTDVADILLQQGADPEARMARMTPLMQASLKGDTKMVALLLHHGADVHACYHAQGSTALAFAARGGHLAVVRRLLDHGAKDNREGLFSASAMSAAKSGGHDAVVRLLEAAAARPRTSSLQVYEPRLWTSTKSGNPVHGAFARTDADFIYVRKEDGSLSKLSKSNLTADDSAYLDNMKR